MNLVGYYKDNSSKYFINMDLIECVGKIDNRCVVWMNSKEKYEVSESAYNTILAYGKAEI